MKDIKTLSKEEDKKLRAIISETGINLQTFAVDFFGLKNERSLHTSSAAARYKRAIIKFYEEFYQPPNAA
jgi:hypothetical protein